MRHSRVRRSVMSDNIHTLGNWINHGALADGNKVAIDDRGVTISYGMLDERVNRLAQRLIDAGYRNGDRIATVAGNSIDQVVLFFACAKAGLVLAPLSWRHTATELAELLVRSKASLLLTEDEFQTLASEALKHAGLDIPLVALGSEGIETEVPAVAYESGEPWRPVVDSDPVLLIFTSGSEAAPKGALLSHKNCFWTNLSLGRAVNFGTDDVALCMLPQFHVGGWNIYLLLGLSVGATCVLERTFNPARALRLIETRGVTAIMGVPTQYLMMSKDPLFTQVNLESLRVAQVGGAYAPAEIIERWRARGVELAPAYGLTEASPNVLYTPAGDPHSGMIPYPHVSVRIAGTTDDSLDSGELQVHGPGVFVGYDDDEARTAEAFTDDGWLRTGDTAARSTLGGIRIVGRSKDIFISGGENVAPAEVERVMLTHPYVDEVAVVGIPDPVWGEVGCAFIVLTPEGLVAHRAAEKAEELAIAIRSHTARSLAAFKVPAHVKIVSELPRISIDKIDRRQLTAEAVAFSKGVQVS